MSTDTGFSVVRFGLIIKIIIMLNRSSLGLESSYLITGFTLV